MKPTACSRMLSVVVFSFNVSVNVSLHVCRSSHNKIGFSDRTKQKNFYATIPGSILLIEEVTQYLKTEKKFLFYC